MKHVPFLLRPVGKDYLWGGERLKTEYHKQIDLTPLAETWECSTHPDGCSIVDSGAAAGKPLRTVLQEHPEYLGIYANSEGELPILIKLIDAKKDLSVQVHPDDAYAKQYENGQNGKTEMWYIAEAEEGAGIYLGFRESVTKEECEKAIKENTLSDKLRFYPVKKGEHYFVPAGTVHAICAGCLVYEIQQNCDLTYRIYDYGRRDKNGNLRELHIKKALETACLEAKEKIAFSAECAEGERIGVSRYFTLTRLKLNGEKRLKTDAASFRAVTCVSGEGKIGDKIMRRGDTFFVPATYGEFTVSGTAELLIAEVRKYHAAASYPKNCGELSLADDLGAVLWRDTFAAGTPGVLTENEKRALASGFEKMFRKTGITARDITYIDFCGENHAIEEIFGNLR